MHSAGGPLQAKLALSQKANQKGEINYLASQQRLSAKFSNHCTNEGRGNDELQCATQKQVQFEHPANRQPSCEQQHAAAAAIHKFKAEF